MKKVTTDADDNDNPGETCQTSKTLDYICIILRYLMEDQVDWR